VRFEAPPSRSGIFKFLREEVVLKTETPRSVDISGECCAALENVMLAQAQEMFYEMLCAKKSADGETSAIKSATLAQVAWSVSEMYTAAADAYMKPVLVKHIQREWGESSKVKALMYQVEAHYVQVRVYAPNAPELGNHEFRGCLFRLQDVAKRVAPSVEHAPLITSALSDALVVHCHASTCMAMKMTVLHSSVPYCLLSRMCAVLGVCLLQGVRSVPRAIPGVRS
jgi:hypothetical protein